jgi:predicted DNA-binding transcriptional regulator AlpA
MTPAPRRKPALADPGPLRLARPQGGSPRHPPDADPIGSPEDPRPQPEALARSQGGSPRGRTLPASIEPMLHIDDLAELLSCSRRLVERMRSAGKIPKPDIHVGRCPRWKPATIRAWIERGGNP